MSEISIDDILMGIEQNDLDREREIESSEITEHSDDDESTDDIESNEDERNEQAEEEDNDSSEEVEESGKSFDEYGNEKEIENPAVRKRLKQQAEKYEDRIRRLEEELVTRHSRESAESANSKTSIDTDSDGDWQKQFSELVKKTVQDMSIEQAQQQQKYIEMQSEMEFTKKLEKGAMEFSDFVDVVKDKPIDETMQIALRGMDNPAAFIYAASSRHSQELERISKLQDPYAKVVEMGRLAERIKKGTATTQAPKPVSRTRDDATVKSKGEKREDTIEDLIAQSNKKRVAAHNESRRRR